MLYNSLTKLLFFSSNQQASRVNDRSASSKGNSGQGESSLLRAKKGDGAQLALFGTNQRQADMRDLLNSSNDVDKLTAMRSIIEKLAKGKDTSDYFAAVANNIVSKNAEIRKLVQIYIMRYSAEHQELGLLPFASLQNLLKVPDPRLRETAIRVLSNMRVSIVIPVVVLCLKSAISDLCPLVRRAVALALPKLYRQDNELLDRFLPMLEQLLSDRTTLVFVAALRAFQQIGCPDKMHLLHTHYHRMCLALAQVDEWSLPPILKLLGLYVRSYMPCGNACIAPGNPNGEPCRAGGNDTKNDCVDERHILISNLRPLLFLDSPSVICATAELALVIGAPATFMREVATSILHLASLNNKEMQYIVLKMILTLVLQHLDRLGNDACTKHEVSQLELAIEQFRLNVHHFYIHHTDSLIVKRVKCNILLELAKDSNVCLILHELQALCGSHRPRDVLLAVRTIGHLCVRFDQFQLASDQCQSLILDLLSNSEDDVRTECITILRYIIQKKPERYSYVLNRVIKVMEKLHNPQAVSTVVWLIGSDITDKGQFNDGVHFQILKRLLIEWNEQAIAVKYQVLTLAAKVFLTDCENQVNRVMFDYAIAVSQRDSNPDIRDRASFLDSMIRQPNKFPMLFKYRNRILFNKYSATGRLSKYRSFEISETTSFALNSMSHYLSERVAGYIDLPRSPERVMFADQRKASQLASSVAEPRGDELPSRPTQDTGQRRARRHKKSHGHRIRAISTESSTDQSGATPGRMRRTASSLSLSTSLGDDCDDMIAIGADEGIIFFDRDSSANGGSLDDSTTTSEELESGCESENPQNVQDIQIRAVDDDGNDGSRSDDLKESPIYVAETSQLDSTQEEHLIDLGESTDCNLSANCNEGGWAESEDGQPCDELRSVSVCSGLCASDILSEDPLSGEASADHPLTCSADVSTLQSAIDLSSLRFLAVAELGFTTQATVGAGHQAPVESTRLEADALVEGQRTRPCISRLGQTWLPPAHHDCIQFAEMRPQSFGHCNFYLEFEASQNGDACRLCQHTPLDAMVEIEGVTGFEVCRIVQSERNLQLVTFVPASDHRPFALAVKATTDGVVAGEHTTARFLVQIGPVSLLLPEFMSFKEFESSKAHLRGLCEFRRVVSSAYARADLFPFSWLIREMVRRIGFAIVAMDDNCSEHPEARLSGCTVLKRRSVLLTVAFDAGVEGAAGRLQLTVNCDLPMFANSVLIAVEDAVHSVVASRTLF